MTTMDILHEIQKLPLPERRALADELNRSLSESSNLAADELHRREVEFEKKMLAKGLFSRIASRQVTDEEFFDDFELLEVAGEPLSEQIIRERR